MTPCRKTRYPDKRTAETAMNFRLRKGGVPFLRIYACPRCLGWHMTHKPDRDENGDELPELR